MRSDVADDDLRRRAQQLADRLRPAFDAAGNGAGPHLADDEPPHGDWSDEPPGGAAPGDEDPRDEASAPHVYGHALVSWIELWADAAPAEEWLAEPLLAKGRGHALFAPAKAGKSLLALEVAAGLASGRPVLSQRPGAPVPTLYIDAEMGRPDLRERLEALGYGPDDDLSNLAYYALPGLPPLDSAHGGAALVELVEHHRAELVVIDTVAASLNGEENSADTMRSMWTNTGSPLRAAGRTTLRVDHAGKDLDRGQRGSSAKAGDVDVVWRLTARDRDRLELRATHRRIPWVPELVTLERVEEPHLAHRVIGDSWPAGTAELADRLDALGVAIDASRRVAGEAVRAAGGSAREAVLGAALRYRRSGIRPCGSTPR